MTERTSESSAGVSSGKSRRIVSGVIIASVALISAVVGISYHGGHGALERGIMRMVPERALRSMTTRAENPGVCMKGSTHCVCSLKPHWTLVHAEDNLAPSTCDLRADRHGYSCDCAGDRLCRIDDEAPCKRMLRTEATLLDDGFIGCQYVPEPCPLVKYVEPIEGEDKRVAFPSEHRKAPFTAERVQSFKGKRLFPSGSLAEWEQLQGSEKGKLKKSTSDCERWVVLTSPPDHCDYGKEFEKLSGWCVVVVADTKKARFGAPKVEGDGPEKVVFLGENEQKKLGYGISEHVPWDHFGRKNIGYLYAIQHGAKRVFDTACDHNLMSPLSKQVTVSSLNKQTVSADFKMLDKGSSSALFNPFDQVSVRLWTQHKSPGKVWPRGFPLDNILSTEKERSGPFGVSSEGIMTESKMADTSDFGVIASLSTREPDVDAIYRMTKKLPLHITTRDARYVLNKGVVMPYNAQSSVHTQFSLWGLVLPLSVRERVSDIWRSYMVQRLLWDLGKHVVAVSPFVEHTRVYHTTIEDFEAEEDLYRKAGGMVDTMLVFRPKSAHLAGRLEEAVIDLYERNFIQASDVYMFQAWIKDLCAVGYEFPALVENA
mmetsp:Transcript_16910/g.36720  ORF Transcript_16910/g.36720 Transcript_16910/m.36720 type:complete len:600 (-) Transcript_16910:2443-4242(-)